jgi:hypothetical protein
LKSVISEATLLAMSEQSKRFTEEIPDLPDWRLVQKLSTSLPMEETTPMPVITIRVMNKGKT